MRFKPHSFWPAPSRLHPCPAPRHRTNAPALPLTHERIAALPPDRQPAWRKCLGRSERQMQADRAFLKKEMRNNGPEKTAAPHEVRGVKGIALDRHAAVAWPTRRPPHCRHHRLVPDTVGQVEEKEPTRLSVVS
jgi:hypothetical protein